ncbi:LysR family transcriptional regulator [Hoeflea sp. TYP-13]|uniref:LysR family transcriptional regulator n=1 Tax=Hoeflea sp. TYP-13 TaxID=3230023 RepID=UPI0034C62CBD
MNLRQLEAFRATMRSGSITAAAEILHISQPSVSRLISDLEASVGFPLFLRAGRGLTATVEARRFYRAVEGMFVGIDRLQDLANTIRNTAGGVVSMGIIPSLASIEAPKVVNELYQKRSDIQIMIYERNTPSIVDAVQMQQFDLGIVGRQPPYGGVETLFQTTIPYVCLIPETHELVGEPGPVDLNELADQETFVTFGGVFPDEMLGMDQALSQRLQSRSRLSAANMPVAASLVRETGAFAIVDPFSAEMAVRLGGVAFRPLRQKLNYNIAVITRGRDTLSLEASELAKIAAERLSARVEEVKAFSAHRS